MFFSVCKFSVKPSVLIHTAAKENCRLPSLDIRPLLCFSTFMDTMLPSPVRRVLQTLLSGGYDAYTVGGCVRDMLLRATPMDWDICTSARPEQVIACFPDTPVIKTGIRHGTVTVIMCGQPIEVTTYRIDGAYTDHRRPDQVSFTGNLTEDLARRDFTINAMAYRPDVGVVDPFGGRRDLAAGIVRCVGVPSERFAEDALRILRALRFSSRYGFALDEDTARAMLDARKTLTFVSAERVLAELLRMDFSRIPERFLPVLQAVIPELRALPAFAELPGDPASRMAALLRGLDAEGILTRLKASHALRTRVAAIVSEMDTAVNGEADIRRMLWRIGPDAAKQLFLLKKDEAAAGLLARVLARGDCYQLSMLAVHGRDAQLLGLTGKAIGTALEALLQTVIDGTLPNTRETLLAALKEAARLSP